MGAFEFESPPFICRVVAGHEAPFMVDQMAKQLDSDFVRKSLLAEHPGGGLCVRDQINFVLFIELPPNKVLGIVFAELELQLGVGFLHLIYVPRDNRKQGFGPQVLERFDDFLHKIGFHQIVTAPVNRASLKLFKARQKISPLSYDLLIPPDEILDDGDRELLLD